MAKFKVLIKLDSNKLYQLLESAIDNFKQMESNHLFDVDLEKCSKDYVSALMIYNQTLFTQTFIES